MVKRMFQTLVTVWTLSLVLAPASWAQTLTATVFPSSLPVSVGTPATTRAVIFNEGPGAATGCGVSLITSLPATFAFRAGETGTANAPVDIPPGASQSFVFAFTPTAPAHAVIFGFTRRPSTELSSFFACSASPDFRLDHSLAS